MFFPARILCYFTGKLIVISSGYNKAVSLENNTLFIFCKKLTQKNVRNTVVKKINSCNVGDKDHRFGCKNLIGLFAVFF